METDGNKIYRKTEVVGTSKESLEDAITHAVKRAQQTIRQVMWFEVLEQRGRIDDGEIQFQVTLAVGFELERIEDIA